MIRKSQLDNGARIVTETITGVHSITIGIWVKAGARNESAHEQGLAHFIEHMLFKGTSRYSAFEIARRIDSVGGMLNAFTAKEYTCFYVKVLSRHCDLAIELLCDIFFDSLFDAEEIEKERNVVLQEISMVRDTPDDYVQDLFNQAFFGDHPLGYNILGEIETVQGFNHDMVAGFFEREYRRPRHLIIAAAGNLEHQSFVDRIQVRFGSIPAREGIDREDRFAVRRRVDFHYRELEQVQVCLGTRGLSHLDGNRYVLHILNTVLGGSMSSRLFQEIRENRGLAYTVYSFMTSFLDTGMFGVSMGVLKETVRESLDITHRELKSLRDCPIRREELIHAQEQLKGNLLLALEGTDSRMSRLAKCELYYDAYVPVEEILNDIDAVTPDQVQALARELFRDELFTYTFLGPIEPDDLPASNLTLAGC
jgi:predicted Zn-dependent peptidase